MQVSARLQLATIAVCLLVLLFYFGTALSVFNFRDNALGPGTDADTGAEGRGWFNHNSPTEFLLSLPFGLWFMDGFEDIPLAVDYAEDPGDVGLCLSVRGRGI